MNPMHAGLLIRMLTEYEFSHNAPSCSLNKSVYKMLIDYAARTKFSDEAIEYYNQSLNPDEQFGSIKETRQYVESTCDELIKWATK